MQYIKGYKVVIKVDDKIMYKYYFSYNDFEETINYVQKYEKELPTAHIELYVLLTDESICLIYKNTDFTKKVNRKDFIQLEKIIFDYLIENQVKTPHEITILVNERLWDLI